MKDVEMKYVSSSNIQTIGYDEEEQTLVVKFTSGSIYHYFNVPENIYIDMMCTTSFGGFLNDNIKNVYKFERVA